MASVTSEGLSKRQYWDFDVTRRIRFKSFNEYAEGFYYYFEQAVRRRLRSMSPIAVSVSGGLDSSSIFCLAETLKRKDPQIFPKILGFSYIFKDGTPVDEKSFLSDIERDYSVSIKRIPAGPQGIIDGNREEIWYVESPFLNGVRNFTEPLYKEVQQSGVRLLLTGDMGDQMLFSQAYLLDLFNHLAWDKVWAHLREFKKWNLDVDPKFFRRIFFRNLLKSYIPPIVLPFLRKIKRNLNRYQVSFPVYKRTFQERSHQYTSKNYDRTRFATCHAKSLYHEVKSEYNVFRYEWANKMGSIYGIEYAYPYLDQDLVAYLMAIPGEMQTWNGVPKGVLRVAMRGILPAQILERRWKADGTELLNDRVAHDFPRIVESLQTGGLAVGLGYIDGKILSSELTHLGDKIRRSDCLVSWALCDLLGLELWLQVFFGEKNHGGRDQKYERAY
jgi:asparagine synthase (glutamine-hydrolysing)